MKNFKCKTKYPVYELTFEESALLSNGELAELFYEYDLKISNEGFESFHDESELVEYDIEYLFIDVNKKTGEILSDEDFRKAIERGDAYLKSILNADFFNDDALEGCA